MRKIIQFEHVSKQYRLGMTRTSLPTALYQWVGTSLKRVQHKPRHEQVLWALRDVSFELERGQSLALIGPNGAGKTTVLKLLSNITKPTSGRIKIDGQVSALIELGAGFHPDLSGRENIYLNGTILGYSRKEISQRFDEIVAFSELERFIDTPVKRYSSGMTVRLGFAVAACSEPDILLVDEVLAVGDASFRQKCMERIRSMLNNGTTLIFVSHNMGLVQTTCNTALYLDHGRIIHHGNTLEVIEAYDRALNEERARKLESSQSEKSKTTKDVEITKVEVISLDGQGRKDLCHDRPAEVRIHYIAYKDIGACNMVVRVVRSDGVSCCFLRTSTDSFKLVVEHGTGVVSVVLDPVQLYTGTYFVRASFKDGSDTIGIVSGWSKLFHVRGSTLSYLDKGPQFKDAIFEPSRRWDHYQGRCNP